MEVKFGELNPVRLLNTLLSYLKNKTSGGFQMKRELIAGVVLTIVLFFGTIFSIPPFKTIVDVGEYFTESWEKKEQRAPVAHTEALSIKELSKQVVAMSPAAIMQKLRDKSIAVEDADQTLKEIGEKNNMSPYEIYKMISEGEEKRKTGNLFSHTVQDFFLVFFVQPRQL